MTKIHLHINKQTKQTKKDQNIRNWDCPCGINGVRILNAWNDFIVNRCEYCTSCLWKPPFLPTFHHVNQKSIDSNVFETFDSSRYLKAVQSRIELLHNNGYTSLYPILPVSDDNNDDNNYNIIQHQKKMCESSSTDYPVRRSLVRKAPYLWCVLHTSLFQINVCLLTAFN